MRSRSYVGAAPARRRPRSSPCRPARPGGGPRRAGGQLADHVLEVGLRHRDGSAQLLGPRAGRCWRNFSVSRTQPMSTDTTPSGSVGADDELGRAAADVDDEERARRRGRARRWRRRRRGGPPRRPTAARAGAPSDLGGGVEEVVAVGGVAGGRGGRCPHPLDAVAVHDLAGSSRSTSTVRSTAARVERGRWRRRPAPRRVMGMRRSSVLERPSAPSVGPPAGGWSWCRSRWRRRGRSSARVASWSATHRPTGSSPPARNQA